MAGSEGNRKDGYYEGDPPWMAHGNREDGYPVLDPRDYRDVPGDMPGYLSGAGILSGDVYTELLKRSQLDGKMALERAKLEQRLQQMRDMGGASVSDQEVERMRHELQQWQLDRELDLLRQHQNQGLRKYFREAGGRQTLTNEDLIRIKKAFQEGVDE